MSGEEIGSIRLAIFGGLLIVLLQFEAAFPRRRPVRQGWRRRVSNLLLAAINTVVVRLVPPLSAVVAAGWASSRGWGLLAWIDLPPVAETIVVVVLLDLLIFVQHLASHRIPALWSFHKVHHADIDLDVTSALRFHPGEIVVSAGLKTIAAVLLGASAEAILLFEVLLNGVAMFNHANLAIPAPVDLMMRIVVVTPDMHRIHHSFERGESDTNFGFNLPWWDWLFGTYLAAPAAPQQTLPLGVAEEPHPDQTGSLPYMLAMPFRTGGPANSNTNDQAAA